MSGRSATLPAASGSLGGAKPGLSWRRAFPLCTALLMACVGCGPDARSVGYWLWAGVAEERVPAGATVYAHVGAVHSGAEGLSFEAQGLGPRELDADGVVVVLRMTALAEAGDLLPLLEEQVTQWHRRGNRVVGVQLDYDAATAKLLRYQDMLGRLRQGLDPDLSLGITGLMDWVYSGRRDELEGVAGQVDEIVFQLYRGRDYHRPLASAQTWLSRLDFDFKVGLLSEHPDNEALLASLADLRHLTGLLYFVRNGNVRNRS